MENLSEKVRESRLREMFGNLTERKTEEDAVMRTWNMDVSAKRKRGTNTGMDWCDAKRRE